MLSKSKDPLFYTFNKMNGKGKGILHEDTDEDDYKHSMTEKGKGLLNEESDDEDYGHNMNEKGKEILYEDTDEDDSRQSMIYDKVKGVLDEDIDEDDSTQGNNENERGIPHEDADKNDYGHSTLTTEVQSHISSRELQKRTPTTPKNDLLGVSQSELRMGYDDLGPLLKRCLLFLSVFPANKIINKKSLIYWWIGEGLVKPAKGLTAEQVGEECFQMLLLNGLIQPISKRHDKTAGHCIVDPTVQEMLVSISANDGFFVFDSGNRPTVNTKESARACLVATRKEQVVAVSLQPNPNVVLSLFNANARHLKLEKIKFSRLKSIVVLQLGRWQNSIDYHLNTEDPKSLDKFGPEENLTDFHIEIEDNKFLDNLGIMQTLRYLSLRGISGITTLPDSCKGLTNLQILDLRGCHHLETLPNEISLMKNLTHLDVSECPFLERIPKGIDKLSELQVLKGFILSDTAGESSCELSELTVLKNLRKLSIKVAAHVNMDELKGFTSLRSLTISWGRVIVSSMTFPPHLEKLDLQRIPQDEIPSWLRPADLQKLKRLYIRGGKLKSLNLETETQRWNVKTLRFRFLNELEWDDWSELEKAFPLLACIEIFGCRKLKENPKSLPPLIDEDGVWIKKKEESFSGTPSTSTNLFPV